MKKSRLKYIIISSLSAQIISYILAINIINNTKGASDFSGIGALIPISIFALLGLINIILTIIYFLKGRRVRVKDLPLVLLFLANLILFFSYNMITQAIL